MNSGPMRGEWLSGALWRGPLALASGVLLAAAFPPVGEAAAAWFAVIPLLLAVRSARAGSAFVWGLLAGCAYWLCTLFWLLRLGETGAGMPLAVLAWVLLSAYCALYLGAFSMVAAALLPRVELPEPGDGVEAGRFGPAIYLRPLVGIPLIWVGFEHLRSILFGGFPWNALGVSQYTNLAVIQIAEWGGVSSVSALLMLMNTAVALAILRACDAIRARRRPRLQLELFVALMACAACMAYGLKAIRRIDARQESGATTMRVAAVQTGVPQSLKWDSGTEEDIYRGLTEQIELVSLAGPDLTVIPETVIPGDVLSDPQAMLFVKDMSDFGVPLLLGAIEIQPAHPDAGWAALLGLPAPGAAAEPALAKSGPGPSRYYNSSFLIPPKGQGPGGVYRKQHLVPFGEYIPLDRTLPILREMAPLGISMDSGTTATVFRLNVPVRGLAPEVSRSVEVFFTVLICFEDAFPGLARAAVRNGARLLINQTNDAWFDGSSGHVQHMSHCVFRCVENRVPAVRSANTGVTCAMDSCGRTTLLRIREGGSRTVKTRWTSDDQAAGFQLFPVRVPSRDQPLTFYAKYGDMALAGPCAIVSLAGLGWILMRWRRERKC